MFAWPPVGSPRREAVVERQVEEYFPKAVERWSSKFRASINVVGFFETRHCGRRVAYDSRI